MGCSYEASPQTTYGSSVTLPNQMYPASAAPAYGCYVVASVYTLKILRACTDVFKAKALYFKSLNSVYASL